MYKAEFKELKRLSALFKAIKKEARMVKKKESKRCNKEEERKKNKLWK